jgi:hypothetical protein
MTRILIILTSLVAILGMGGQCTQQQQQTSTSTVVTLAGLAAANNRTVAGIVVGGQLFCQKNGGTINDVVAVAAPIAGALMPQWASVINVGAGVVASTCASIDAIPVPPPTTVPLASVPVVVTPAAVVLKPAS